MRVQNHRQRVFNGVFDIAKIYRSPLIYTVSYFTWGGLSPSPKPPRGDGTARVPSWSVREAIPAKHMFQEG